MAPGFKIAPKAGRLQILADYAGRVSLRLARLLVKGGFQHLSLPMVKMRRLPFGSSAEPSQPSFLTRRRADGSSPKK